MTIKSEQQVAAEHLRRQKATSTDPDWLEREARLLEGKMPDSMIELVARAILESDHGAGSWDESGMPEWAKEAAIYHARAAIQAMRVPTEEMVVAGVQGPLGDMAARYQSMIDVALAANKP